MSPLSVVIWSPGEVGAKVQHRTSIEFCSKTYKLGSRQFRVDFVIIPETERGRLLLKHTVKGAAAIVFACSLSQQACLESLCTWMKQTQQLASEGDGQDAPFRLVLAVSSGQSARCVSTSALEQTCNEHGAVFYETDSTTGAGVSQAFLALVSAVAMRLPDPLDPALLLGCQLKTGPLVTAELARHCM